MWYHYYIVAANLKLTAKIHRITFRPLGEPLREAHAGQFAMVYIPGNGELPLSVFRQRNDVLEFLVEDYGGPSHDAVGLKEGQLVGVRGPYGRGFTLKPNTKYLLVAGGSGAPPLLKFIEEARGVEGVEVDYILGAKTASELFLLDEAERMGAHVHVSTDDGSRGFKGYATQLAEELLSQRRYDAIYACGPEPMLLGSMLLAKKFKLYFEGSFVRDVRCAVGACGLCVMEGTGLLLCRDGPVFTAQELEGLEGYAQQSLGEASHSGA